VITTAEVGVFVKMILIKIDDLSAFHQFSKSS